MAAAGWTRADDVSLATGWRIVTSTLTGRSYAEAPVSPLLLFGRQQDFAYQQEVEGSPSRRHHVRFWKCPPGWLLPGGFAVDWLAAGTYDRSVGLSLFTGQITHKIDEDVDVERDHIIATVTAAEPGGLGGAPAELLHRLPLPQRRRRPDRDRRRPAGGRPLGTARPSLPSPGAQPRPDATRRPPQVVFGAVVAALLGLEYLGILVLLWLPVPSASPTSSGPSVGVEVGVGVMALVNLVLAVALLAGRDWARVLLCASSALSIVDSLARQRCRDGADLAELESRRRRGQRARAAGPLQRACTNLR